MLVNDDKRQNPAGGLNAFKTLHRLRRDVDRRIVSTDLVKSVEQQTVVSHTQPLNLFGYAVHDSLHQKVALLNGESRDGLAIKCKIAAVHGREHP